MLSNQRARRRVLQISAPVVGLGLIAYFAYYTVEGERGIMTLTRLQNQTVKSEAALTQLVDERTRLERKVQSLRPSGLDLDRLDEQVRTMLNYAHPNDLIVPVKPPAAGAY